jgi:heme/copper-type cytochrome/quinol oxidase subunit 2
MGWLWWVGAVAIIAWVVALVDIIRGRGRFTGGQLAAWILLVIILPVIGTILYFVVGRRPSA